MRVLIALDINDDDLAVVNVTPDDIVEGLRARLGEFYPSDDGYPIRASVVAVADVSESYGALLDALTVGLEGLVDEPAIVAQADAALKALEDRA